MIDAMPQAGQLSEAPVSLRAPAFNDTDFDAPPPMVVPLLTEPHRRHRWVLFAVAGITVLVIVTFAVFAFGVVGASAAGGCGGP